MTQWKIISTKSAAEFESQLNEAMREGYVTQAFVVKNANIPDMEAFTAVLSKPVDGNHQGPTQPPYQQ